jgi:hypothetical protein
LHCLIVARASLSQAAAALAAGFGVDMAAVPPAADETAKLDAVVSEVWSMGPSVLNGCSTRL